MIMNRYDQSNSASSRAARRLVPRKLICVLLLLLWCQGCAHYPLNPPLESFDLNEGYRYHNLSSPDNSDELFIVLALSGGGTRAAAFAYGVMKQLRDTIVHVNGKPVRLVDEIDVISSVSGGSMVAAYYGAFGNDLFTNFEHRVLKRPIQRSLILAALIPWNAIKIFSPWFGRSDLVAELYDEHIYDHMTYGDLVKKGRRPFIMINATDMTLGRAFQFTQDQFDLLGSDLSAVSLGRAVAASSAVPILLSPVTFRSYPENEVVPRPAWIQEHLQLRMGASRKYLKAKQADFYLNKKDRPFVHLLDGGITDNLGVANFSSLNSTVADWKVGKMFNARVGKYAVIITVDAEKGRDTSMAKYATLPPLMEVISTTVSGFMHNATKASAGVLKRRLDRIRDSILQNKEEPLPDSPSEATKGDDEVFRHDLDIWMIEISFEGIRDDSQRGFFENIATSLQLPNETVDRLIEAGGRLLRQSDQFQQLKAALE